MLLTLEKKGIVIAFTMFIKTLSGDEGETITFTCPINLAIHMPSAHTGNVRLFRLYKY